MISTGSQWSLWLHPPHHDSQSRSHEFRWSLLMGWTERAKWIVAHLVGERLSWEQGCSMVCMLSGFLHVETLESVQWAKPRSCKPWQRVLYYTERKFQKEEEEEKRKWCHYHQHSRPVKSLRLLLLLWGGILMNTQTTKPSTTAAKKPQEKLREDIKRKSSAWAAAALSSLRPPPPPPPRDSLEREGVDMPS